MRSERSLIQTSGRAARNLNGKVIFYGNTITRSMKAAIDETNRRRAIQTAFNLENNITPKGIVKRVKDMIDGVYDVEEGKRERKAAQDQAKYESLSEKDILKAMKKLEKEMHDAAKNLEFEKAADFRDQLKRMKAKFYGTEVPDLKE